MDQEIKKPFWELKELSDMTKAEWEALCDGCGRCCLLKLEDDDTSEIYLTRLSCRLLDIGTCRCTNYEKRHELVDDCLTIDQEKVKTLSWLPKTCAYRRLSEGRGLAWWHPLVSGDPMTVHQAGISVRGWARPETTARVEELERYIIDDFDDE